MKKTILIIGMLTAAIAIVIVLSSRKSEKEPFRGVLVCKEYIPAHWDDVRVEAMQEAYVPVPIAPIIAANYTARRNSSMARSYVSSRWIYYVANKHEVRDYYVDSLTYIRHNVCDRLIIK